MSLRSLIRTIPDYPKSGIQFRDITTLLKDAAGFGKAIDSISAEYSKDSVDVVAGIEARGFPFASAIAYVLGKGFVPIRKSGKLPAETIFRDFQLEYGTDRIELHVGAIEPGQRVLLVDDLIATGGTAAAAVSLLREAGASDVKCAFVVLYPIWVGEIFSRVWAVMFEVFATSKAIDSLRIGGKHYRSIWRDPTSGVIRIIDQTALPHRLVVRDLPDLPSVVEAISAMRVRGAPLIGAAAAYGIALALGEGAGDRELERSAEALIAARPTAVNLGWAVNRVVDAVGPVREGGRRDRATLEADVIANDDVATCESIGEAGLDLLKRLVHERGSRDRPARPFRPLNILTHCNAGWLATVDWGTALAPVYKAHEAGIPLHVWVDETRPRNQGASITAFELREMGIPHTVIVDNAGGHLMQRGEVDMVIVGSDRTTATGDVCNKIGTYLKALAGHDNGVPFYVALPLSTVDWSIEDGLSEIPIEERDSEEVRVMTGLAANGETASIELFAKESPAVNPAFDVTPARYVTGLITERGICDASRSGLASLRAAGNQTW